MEEKWEYQRTGEHYNNLIWTVFGAGIALTLFIIFQIWTNKNLNIFMQIIALTFGYLILVYCSLAVESFGEKKDICFKVSNKLSFTPMKGKLGRWETFILSFIFLTYLGKFICLIYPLIGKDSLIFIFMIFIFSIMFCLFVYVINSWIRGYEFRDKLK